MPERLVQRIREIQACLSGEQPRAVRQQLQREICDLKGRLWECCKPRIIDKVNVFALAYPDRREDFFQVAYLELEEAIKDYDFNRAIPFTAYFYLRVASELTDLARRRTALLSPGLDEIAARSGPLEFEEELGQVQLRQRILETLSTLLPRDKLREQKIAAFKKRHFEEWTVEAIAADLNEAPTRVSQWIHRVKETLRETLIERYPEIVEDSLAGF